jgi:hypothetical protein
MVTFWESEEAIRAFAGDDIGVTKYYEFDKDFLLSWSHAPRSTRSTIIKSQNSGF